MSTRRPGTCAAPGPYDAHRTETRGRKPAIDRGDVLHILGYYDDLDLVAERLGVQRNSLDVWMRRNGVAIPQHIRIATADRMSAMQMHRRDGIRR